MKVGSVPIQCSFNADLMVLAFRCCGISHPHVSFQDIFITEASIAKEGTKKKARAEYRTG